jgi:hypothetical protein
MVFSATFNNISAISYPAVLLEEETGEPGENHRPVASHRQTLSHNIVGKVYAIQLNVIKFVSALQEFSGFH